MRANKIRQLAIMLHTNHSPAVRSYVQEQLEEMGLDMTHLCQELEMTNPFIQYFRYEGYERLLAQVHDHRFYEIVYCQSNCQPEYLIGSHRYQAQRGDILIVPPGVSHAIMMPDDNGEPFKGYFLWVSLGFMEMLQSNYVFFRERLVKEGVLLRTAGTVWEHLNDYFCHAVEETELQVAGWESAVAGITMILLTQLSRAAADSSLPALNNEEPELLDQILVYVERFLFEKISLQETCNRFFVSQSTITHLFHRKLGVSFYKYITQRRLTEAKNLMREGMPLEKIAVKVGFDDYSTFYRAFKKEFGISPRQFSKVLTGKESRKEPNREL